MVAIFKAYVAEFLGTALLTMTVLLTSGNPLLVAAALALIIFIAAPHSGAHANPAISIAMAIRGTLMWPRLPMYIASQVGGAIAAYYLYKVIR
jgi:glycerol uptake facilitator-like aquaporin